jgi:hypothetical protein
MNTISKFTSFIAVALLTSGAALAGDTVVQTGPYGQGGTITYHKRAEQKTTGTTVALYTDRHGVGQAAAPDQQQPRWVFHSETFGSFGNGSPVSYYSQSR